MIAFHDLVTDRSVTYLLEEDAGTQDGDLIGSLIYLFLTQQVSALPAATSETHPTPSVVTAPTVRRVDAYKDVILVLDNCS